jgi:hypothetical protein
MYSDAQKHLLMYHHQSVAARTSGKAEDKPVSPRLMPLGSPGPVTPLELEQKEGYLLAGTSQVGSGEPADLVERLIREEVRKLMWNDVPASNPQDVSTPTAQIIALQIAPHPLRNHACGEISEQRTRVPTAPQQRIKNKPLALHVGAHEHEEKIAFGTVQHKNPRERLSPPHPNSISLASNRWWQIANPVA